jgi:hypothetical protein
VISSIIPNFKVILYALFVLAYGWGIFLVYYHLDEYGIGKGSRIILFAFIVGSIILLFFNSMMFFSISWTDIFSGFVEKIPAFKINLNAPL